MASIYKVQIEDENGNIHYPHTAASVVFLNSGKNAEETLNGIKEQMDHYANISVVGESLQLPGSDQIGVSGETLTLPNGL